MYFDSKELPCCAAMRKAKLPKKTRSTGSSLRHTSVSSVSYIHSASLLSYWGGGCVSGMLMEAGAVLNLPSCEGGGSKVSGPLLHSVTREEMRPWLTLLHHLAPHPSRQVTEPRGHLCLEAGHTLQGRCRCVCMWSNVCIWWWVYLRRKGKLETG